MNPKLKHEYNDALFDAILTLQDRDECYRFFEDLCSIAELKSIAQRFAVARMLHDGKVYSEIVEATGASTATISRVNRALTNGCDAFKMVFDRMEQEI